MAWKTIKSDSIELIQQDWWRVKAILQPWIEEKDRSTALVAASASEEAITKRKEDQDCNLCPLLQ
jgi:hypothetical protein